MAKNAPGSMMPVDAAISLAPGVTFRETEAFVWADKGFGPGTYGAPGKAKGNRGWDDLPPRMATTAGVPFANLRGGR
jgi:hypothetical protein